jgi:hypothetical protein
MPDRLTYSLLVGFFTASMSVSADEGVELFEKKIRPVLVEHCYECHSGTAEKANQLKGGLLLDTRGGVRRGGESGPAVVAGKAEVSLLIRSLQYESFEMPPKGKLSDAVIADFAQWINLGAPDPRLAEAPVAATRHSINIEKGREFWAFQRPKTTSPPGVNDAAWPKSDIDRFVLAKLEQRGLSPVQGANRHVLLRRATYDLVGRPPTPQEIDDFINDHSEDAFNTVVDRLLNSPQFGERWGRYWLDLAQYGDTLSTDFFFAVSNAWRYRDYVIRSLNADKPYDQFIVEQIAGDLLPSDNDEERGERLIATGFLALGPWLVGLPRNEQLLMDIVDLQIDKVSRSMLGMTTTCARCHDHKFDPIAQTDYFALAGIFRSTKTLDGQQGQNGPYLDWLRRPLPETPAAVQERMKASEQHAANVAKLEAELEDSKTTEPRKLAIREELDLLKGEPPTPPVATAVGDSEEPKDCRINIRGQAEDLGEEVRRGFMTVVHDGSPPDIPADQSGRLQLARWIASSDNPLTARVMVNRIWHHLFGAGLVRTVDNFGTMGERSSHPELLDWLTVRFTDQGWSVKNMIRQIVLSQVYQQGNQNDDAALAEDPQNRLLWRMNRRRLDADAIRDAILVVSCNVNETRGGPTLPPVKIDRSGNRKEARVLATSSPAPEVLLRRTIYLPILRKEMPREMDMLATFNFADPAVVSGDRDETIVPTQALYLLNSPFVREQSRVAAQRLLNQTGFDDAARVAWFYLTVLGRQATQVEIETSLAFIDRMAGQIETIPDHAGSARNEAWSRMCQSLFACNEFIFRD